MSRWIEQLANRLEAVEGQEPAGGRLAAVAALLYEFPDGPRVLLMKRAERIGDPWSGHISLPGGGYQSSDRALLTTAIREAQEELGLELAGARLLGQLPPMHPRTSGHGIAVTPFVFATDVAVEPRCGPEALAAFWLPIELAASGSIDSTYLYAPTGTSYPSWTYEGHVIWGLTWRVLQELLERGR